MKGKILKRVASAMLGLMVAFAAIEVNTAFAEDVLASGTTATITLTNFHNDGRAAGDKCYFDVYINFVPTKEEDKGKTVKITELAFNVEFAGSDKIDCNDLTKTAFTRVYQTDFDGGVVVNNTNHTIGYAYRKVPTTTSESMDFIAGQNTFLGTMTATEKADPGDTYDFLVNGSSATGNVANVAAKDAKGNASAATKATITMKFCKHDNKDATYTDINAKTHTLNCPDCKQAIVQNHKFDQGNEQAAQADANKLGGKGRKCRCGLWGWEDLKRLDGAAAYLMPDGKTWISAYEGLNQAILDIEGYKVIVQDALNELGGKEMLLTATEAPADSALRKNLESVISKDGKAYFIELKMKDGSAIKLNDGVRSLYQIPDGVEFDKFSDILKKAGVSGVFSAKAEKINDKEYVAVWSKTVGPYVLPNGAAPVEKKKEDPKKKGTQTKTGDAAGMVCLAASGLLVVAGLYMELMKKKKNA